MRINKTKKNLQEVWQKLDNAYESLENAFTILASMTKLPGNIINGMESIDLSAIIGLKCDIEELMEKEK